MQECDFTVLTFQTMQIFLFSIVKIRSSSSLGKMFLFVLSSDPKVKQLHQIYSLHKTEFTSHPVFCQTNKNMKRFFSSSNFGSPLLSLNLIGCGHIISSHCRQTTKSCSFFCSSLNGDRIFWSQPHIGFTKKAKYVPAFSVPTCTSCHYSRCSYCSWGCSHGLS